MADLTDYGFFCDPQIAKQRSLSLGPRTVGHIGVDVEHGGAKCYVSEREAGEHRYHGEDPWYDLPFDGDAYGLSLELFERLDDAGVGRVYIPETDTGDVYQFSFQQFVHGEPINYDDASADYDKDIQKVVPIAEAVEVWEGAYPDLYTRSPAFR